MSNLGQAALIVVGTVVGAYFGNPQLGFALGALVGSELFPTQLPSGPKLTDNRTTTANIGDPCPIGFGDFTVSGTVIWLAPFVEHTNKTGGKGGPTQTTYSYTQSIAIGLVESAVDLQQAIAGILRIWENGAVVYDIRPQQQFNSFTGQPAESDDMYANRLAASAAYASTFTLHLGSEDQIADPTIEAIEGFGNVPAFRGLAYIVFANRVLQISQGLRHPNFTFEIYSTGVGNCTSEPLYSQGVLYPWLAGGNPNPNNTNTFQILDADPAAPNFDGTPITNNYIYATLEAAIAVTNAMYAQPCDTHITYALNNGAGLSVTSMVGGGTAAGGNGGIEVNPLQYHSPDPSEIQLFFAVGNAVDGIFNDVAHAGGQLTTPGQIVEVTGNLYLTTGSSSSGAAPPLAAPFVVVHNLGFGYPYWVQRATNVVINVHREAGAPRPLCEGLPPWSVNPAYAVKPDGSLILCDPWTIGPTANYFILQPQGIRVGGQQDNYTVVYPLNPCLPQFDARNTEAFWTAAYLAAVAIGSMPAGYTYDAAGGGGPHYPFLANFGAYQVDRTICTGSSNGATLDTIVSALCGRAGVSSIDVSDLATVSIQGYSISSVCDATNAIQPLRSVGFFDAVESGPTLFFRKRGKPIVATLTTDQIGAYDGGTSGATVPPSVKVNRVDETTLPRSIRLHYKSMHRDFQDAQQISPFRLTTKAINDQDVSLPFCLDDSQALQAAEILWSDAWAAKNIYALAIDQSLSEIEVGDAVGIPVDGFIQRARIISEQNASGVLRTLSLVSDNDGAYISYAIAEYPQVPGQILVLLTGTAIELLDLPALQDVDNDAGFYIAANRTGPGNTWKGCVIYKSIDNGTTWASQFAMVVEATIGTLHATPAVSEFFTWDDVTTITVDLNSSAYSLESRTDDAVLAGANAAAIGADGRWEIIQYANATQLSATQWRLSRLLRGRRGTEHNIGKSVATDTFVVISTGDLSRSILSTSEIGALRDYDAPSIGASFSSGTIYPFAGHAQALKPFSPVDVRADLESNGDILIRWTRRDRLGRTLMSGVDMPLSEATLAFQIDILDGPSPSSPEVVVRTLTTSTISVIYTHAQQITDFGSPANVTQLRCAVYQMSAVVGRGTPAIQTITIGVSP